MNDDKLELKVLQQCVSTFERAMSESPNDKCAREIDVRGLLGSLTGCSGRDLDVLADRWLVQLTSSKRSLNKGLLKRCTDSRLSTNVHKYHVRAFLDPGSAPAWERIRELLGKIPEPPPASKLPFVPEAPLSEASYERILTTINNGVLDMERRPSAFASWGEEHLRDQILVLLNGLFEGRASAETFRGQGKTDILLIDQDRSVFIAECKIWRGAKSLTEAVDQLLDDSIWRDARAAIVLFNRNKIFPKVLAQLEGIVHGHSQVVGPVQKLGETVHRFSLKKRDDPKKLIIVTLQAFNIPEKVTVSDRLAPGKGRRKKSSPVKSAPILALKET